jgi:hypothetical protein
MSFKKLAPLPPQAQVEAAPAPAGAEAAQEGAQAAPQAVPQRRTLIER